MKQYDAIIIGFGKGGKLLAAETVRTELESSHSGTLPPDVRRTCVNVGCIPTKALIHESEYAERRYQTIGAKPQSKLHARVARLDACIPA